MKKYNNTNFNIVLIIFVIMIAVCFLIWNFVTPRQNNDSFTQNSNDEKLLQKPTPESITGWKTLSNLNHTLQYPSEASAEARKDESIVHFMGQKQINSGRTQTELFDGYSFRVGEIINDSKLTLEQLSINERKNAQNNCLERENGQISQLETVLVSEQTGYQYSAVGCYVDYTETIISFKDRIYRISQSYVGDEEDQKKYQKITNQILSTLKFTK